MTAWTLADIPSQHNRTAVVTGTGGLGYETALALARAGGDVILAGRNPTKGEASVAAIKAQVPAARIRFEALDLANLASVAAFAERLSGQIQSLDLLVNNAGVMMLPDRKATADGFEMQFGTNHLGHFALTAHLLPLLRRGAAPRVVSVSSIAHCGGRIHFDDPQWQRSYKPWPAYGQSKLAVLMFALELQRRSEARGWGLMSNAAHPGFALTSLMENGPGTSGLMGKAAMAIAPLLSQSAAAGAWPLLFAATSPDAKGGGYYGPQGFQELKGPPGPAKIKPHALDRGVADRLWTLSDQATGAPFGSSSHERSAA